MTTTFTAFSFPESFQTVTITHAHSQRPALAGVKVATIMAGLKQNWPPIPLKAMVPNFLQALFLDVAFGIGGIMEHPRSDHIAGRHERHTRIEDDYGRLNRDKA